MFRNKIRKTGNVLKLVQKEAISKGEKNITLPKKF
jgi:hypothetical protein